MTAERVLDRLDQTRPARSTRASLRSAGFRRDGWWYGSHPPLVVIGLAGLALHVALVVTALLGVREVDAAHDEVARVALAQRSFQDADMAHDLVRADALAALEPDLATRPRSAGDGTESLDRAVADFRAHLRRVDAVPLPAHLEALLREVRPLQEAYAEQAERLSDAVATDPSVARSLLPAFNDEFVLLLEQQARVTEAMSTAVAQRQETADREERSVLLRLVGAGVAAVLGLGGLTFLLHRLDRRVAKAHAERQRLLRRAVEASDVERRRLAQDLHDGVIQDLAGVAYAFDALVEIVRDRPAALGLAQQAGDIVHRDVLALRTLLTDLYPPDLDGDGLERAVARMLDDCEREGLRTVLRVPQSLGVDEAVAQVAYRVVREALRNVVKHAHARCVSVTLQRAEDRLGVRVEDDGRGFDTAAAPPEGHLGLRVLRDAVEDVGGRVELRAAADAGTVVDVVIPLDQ